MQTRKLSPEKVFLSDIVIEDITVCDTTLMGICLANNLCVENGLNLSIYSDNCTSTADVAIGTTDRLFTADVYRPNVLVAGHHNSIVNLTALATRFVGLELGGYHLSVTGGIIGQMAAPLPDSENGGIRVEEGHWGAGSGEFWVRGDCRIGIALVPEIQSLPTQVRVTGVQVHGCRVGVKVCDEATGVYLSGNDLTQNQIPTEIAAAALQEVRVL